MVYTLPGIRLPPTVPSVNNNSSSSRSSSSSVHAADHHRKTTTTNTLSLLRKNFFSPRKNFAGKSSHDSESSSFVVAASEKVLVPSSQSDGSSCLKEQFEAADLTLEDPQVSHIEDNPEPEYADVNVTEKKDLEPTSDYSEVDGEKDSVSSPHLGEDGTALGSEESVPLNETISKESDMVRQMSIPPPGTGQRIYEIDPILKAHREHLDYRYGHYKKMHGAIDKYEGGIELFSRGYEKFGFIRSDTGVTYREWAPGAKAGFA